MRRHPLEQTPLGFKFSGHREMQKGTFEPQEVALIKQHLGTASVFVDVGANLGYFACLARFLNKHVIAIEPSLENLEYLYRNLDSNGWNDVEVFPLGLSSRSSIAKMYGGGTSASLLSSWGGQSDSLQRTIALTTLDTLVGERFNGQKLMIKIDVEGVEYDVLKGAFKTLALVPNPVWHIEIGLTEHFPGGINPHFEDIFNLFWAHGYDAWTIGTDKRMVKPDDISRWIKNRQIDFGGYNYLFENTKSSLQ